MTHKDIVKAIANTFNPPKLGASEPLVRYYRADGTPTVKEDEAQYMSRYNPPTKRLRVMLYPHHETIGLFYLGDDEEGDADYHGFETDSALSGP